MPELFSSAEAVAMTMPLHSLTRDEDGRPTVACSASEGAKCRLVCAEDCGAEAWPCGGYDSETDAEKEPHPMRDGGYCIVTLFLEEDPDGCAVAVDAPALRRYSGPIRVSWDDDYYVWEPPVPTGASVPQATS